MNVKPTGGSAFPNQNSDGMTRRQWLAGLAMQGLLAGDQHGEIDEDTLARLAWSQADRMLETENEV